MVKGLDVGYAYTKDNDGHIFRSAYSYSDSSVIGSRKLTIDDKDYFVGTGIQTSEADKADSEMNKVCTINNLVLSGVHEASLCVGLPVGQYKAQKGKLKETIMSYSKSRVWVNGESYNVHINDVFVAMQGVSSLYTLGDLVGEYITIDIGGLTIDVSLVEFDIGSSRLVTCDTWYKGLRTLYSGIVERVNNKFNTKLDTEYAEKIIRRPTISINGKEEGLDFLKPFLLEYTDKITEEIKLKYPYQTAKICLVGGGAKLMHSAFAKRFYSVKTVDNPQFANAKGYYLIACNKFKRV